MAVNTNPNTTLHTIGSKWNYCTGDIAARGTCGGNEFSFHLMVLVRSMVRWIKSSQIELMLLINAGECDLINEQVDGTHNPHTHTTLIFWQIPAFLLDGLSQSARFFASLSTWGKPTGRADYDQTGSIVCQHEHHQRRGFLNKRKRTTPCLGMQIQIMIVLKCKMMRWWEDERKRAWLWIEANELLHDCSMNERVEQEEV